MYRRLFILFPDEAHTRHAIDKLVLSTHIDGRRIHAMARDEKTLQRLPHPTPAQEHDTAWRLERILWNANLGLFGVALAVLVAAWFAGSTGWLVAALAVMAATFVAGLLFTTRLPKAHLSQFREAMSHGEVLLLVDVPVEQVHEVEEYVRHHFPEAVFGGSSWSVAAFGL